MVELVVYDFDGVLTDNRVWVSQDGSEAVSCNRSDGLWMKEIKKAGTAQLILSTEANPVVTARGKKLGIEVIQGQDDKAKALIQHTKEKNISLESVLYIGNDMNDLGCMELVGVSMAPEDSHPDILKFVDTVIPVKGGYGIARFVWQYLEKHKRAGASTPRRAGNFDARNTVCIIPARGGSKGIPHKNLYSIAGRPLLDWSILCALKSDVFSRVIVSSDSETILERARTLGADALKRPDEIAGDTASSEEALLHVLKNGNLPKTDEVVFLQPTSPVRESSDLVRALAHFRKEGLDSLFSSVSVQDRFVWENSPKGFESITYDWRERKRRQEIKERYLENGSFYIFKPHILLETGNRLGGRIGTFEMEKWKSVQIDSPDDIKTAEVFLKSECAQLLEEGVF